jgi:hypothetical protein
MALAERNKSDDSGFSLSLATTTGTTAERIFSYFKASRLARLEFDAGSFVILDMAFHPLNQLIPGGVGDVSSVELRELCLTQ